MGEGVTRSVAQAEGTWLTLLFGWGSWTPPIMAPELAPAIAAWNGPWRDTVTGRRVDIDRTAARVIDAQVANTDYLIALLGVPA